MKLTLDYLNQVRSSPTAEFFTGETFDQLSAQVPASFHVEHTVDDRHATIHASGPVYERGRSPAMGVWINVSFSASTYTASSGSWTVIAGAQITLKYMLVGTTMIVAWYIDGSAVSAACPTLYIAIPANSVGEGNYFAPCSYDDNGTRSTGLARVRQASTVSGGTVIELWKDLRGASQWSASNALAICGQIAFEVSDGAPVLASAVTLTYSGAASGSITATPGVQTPFTTPGTYTITVNGPWQFTLQGIAAGGAGGAADGTGGANQNGGGGGGSGSYTTGTTLSLIAGITYTLVIPPGPASGSNGAALTFVNTTGSVTLVSLGGGLHGTQPAAGAGGTATVGSNLVNGKNGGVGATQAVANSSADGTADTSGAGSGGGGNSADAGSTTRNGGAGKSHAGQAGSGPTTGHGGDGGGWDFNSVPCGAGGGGHDNDNATNQAGRAGQQGGAILIG